MSEPEAPIVGQPTFEALRTYYDERVEGKLRDFTNANPRIEAAILTIAEWAPPNPKRILEIGCGIGATSWRMARAWPDAEVIGADLSPISIEVARTCFSRSNLTYTAGEIRPDVVDGKFDLVVLMDVYEHIARAERKSLHQTICGLLSHESRLILTVPTPEVLERARRTDPSTLQPIDEEIRVDEIQVLARETDTELLFFRKVGIWRYGDYVHAVCGRFDTLADVGARKARQSWLRAAGARVKTVLTGARQAGERRDYLGFDLLAGRSGARGHRFGASLAERKQLGARWLNGAGSSSVGGGGSPGVK